MTRKKMWREIVSFVGMLLVLSSNVCGQSTSLLYPLHTIPLLSGNFGELRATHLHSGVDFKTKGQEGLPVICVADGIIARINVSPTGYGNALYVEHKGGITTVYGHLSRFAPRIEKVLRELQYSKESFAVDANVLVRNLYFRAGDTIAYSGNSGSSMGPHLHFEVRNTESENALNPLRYLPVKDIVGPNIRGVYVYQMTEEGLRGAPRRVEVKSGENRVFQGGKVPVSAGLIGIGIQADDYMKDSWNKLGVYRMKVSVNDNELFQLKMDEISFDQTRLVNEIKDFNQYRENRLVYTTFGNYQDQLLSVRNEGRGYIKVEKDSVVDVVVELWDINGNSSRVQLQLMGKQALPETQLKEGERLLANNRAYDICEGRYVLSLRSDALPYPVICKPEISSRVKDSTGRMEVFSTGAGIYPLLKDARLSVDGHFPAKSLLCLVEKKNRVSPLTTRLTLGGLEASVRVLGEYTVRQDTTPPGIIYMGVGAGRKIKFRIFDDLSGISSYRVEVNGKWCLFNYDAKNRLLEGRMDEPVFVKGKNKLVLTVEDAMKNIATFETEINKK